jgi:molybdopterin-guanine dinucleotide biosynthesis protein A
LTYCADAALLVAWDMPFVSTALLSALRRRGEEESAAVIPEIQTGLEPLCAYYPKACLGVVERQLAAGEMRLSELVAVLPRRVAFPSEQVRKFGAPERLFANVNTATDLSAARRLAMSSDSAHTTERPATTLSSSQ